MEQFIQFTMNNPFHVGSLAVLVAVFVFLEMRKGGKSIGTSELTTLVNKDGAVVLDVREKAEFDKGRIAGALNIPSAKVAERSSELEKYKEKTIIIVDAMGQHSGTVGKTLKAAGFERVVRLSGGMGTWVSDSLPVVKK